MEAIISVSIECTRNLSSVDGVTKSARVNRMCIVFQNLCSLITIKLKSNYNEAILSHHLRIAILRAYKSCVGFSVLQKSVCSVAVNRCCECSMEMRCTKCVVFLASNEWPGQYLPWP